MQRTLCGHIDTRSARHSGVGLAALLSRRRSHRQGHRLRSGGESVADCARRPSLRRRLSRRAVPGRASRVRLPEADSQRHEGRSVDEIHRRREATPIMGLVRYLYMNVNVGLGHRAGARGQLQPRTRAAPNPTCGLLAKPKPSLGMPNRLRSSFVILVFIVDGGNAVVTRRQILPHHSRLAFSGGIGVARAERTCSCPQASRPAT